MRTWEEDAPLLTLALPQRVFLRYPVRDVVAMVRAARRAR